MVLKKSTIDVSTSLLSYFTSFAVTTKASFANSQISAYIEVAGLLGIAGFTAG